MIGGKVIVTYKRKRATAKTDFCHENDLPDESTECSLTTSIKHEEAAEKDTPENRKKDFGVLVELVEDDGIGANILHSADCHHPSHPLIINSPKDSPEGKRHCSGCMEEHDTLLPLNAENFNRIREKQLSENSNRNDLPFSSCSLLDSSLDRNLAVDKGGLCSCRDSGSFHEHKCHEKLPLSSSVNRKAEMELDLVVLKPSLKKVNTTELVATSAPKTGRSDVTKSPLRDTSHSLCINAIAENKSISPLITFCRRSKRFKDVNGPDRQSSIQGGDLCALAVEGSETARSVNASAIQTSGTCSVDLSMILTYSVRNADTGHSVSGAQERVQLQRTMPEDEPALSRRPVLKDISPTVQDKACQLPLKDSLNTTQVPDGIGSNGGSAASGYLSIPPPESHCVVDCNIALESNSVEQPIHNLSRVLGNSMDSTSQSTLIELSPVVNGLTLSIEGIGETPSSDKAQHEGIGETLSSDKAHPPEHGSIAIANEGNDCAKVFPRFPVMLSKNDCLQLFPENRSNDISSIGRAQPEVINCNDSEERSRCMTERWSESMPPSTRSPPSLGCSLPVEPMNDGYAQSSSFFQRPNVGFQSKEFLQDSVSQPFSEQMSSLSRHQMMLDNIVNRARTQEASRSCLDLFQTPNMWLEEELDSLWVGVRRHGRGNWEGIIRDPRLHFLSWRTPWDLAERWQEEMQKLFNDMPVSYKNFPRTPEHLLLDRLNGLFNKKRKESMVDDIQLSLGEAYSQPMDGVHNGSMFKYSYVHDDVHNRFQKPASKTRAYSSLHAIKGRRIIKHWESKGVLPSNTPLNADPTTRVAVNGLLPHWLKEAVPPLPHDPSLLSFLSPVSCSSMQTVDQPFLELGGSLPQSIQSLNGAQATLRTELDGRARCCNFPQVTRQGPNESHHCHVDKPQNLIIIDSDASSEETVSDDHSVRH